MADRDRREASKARPGDIIKKAKQLRQTNVQIEIDNKKAAQEKVKCGVKKLKRAANARATVENPQPSTESQDEPIAGPHGGNEDLQLKLDTVQARRQWVAD
ncbi:hypothetical protein K438DRAFT_301030 [Mycena galopus ATCC 62051]|nr:hypothetical protein K438DRAFT_301030 [Mycena galopus ATCC 62051]